MLLSRCFQVTGVLGGRGRKRSHGGSRGEGSTVLGKGGDPGKQRRDGAAGMAQWWSTHHTCPFPARPPLLASAAPNVIRTFGDDTPLSGCHNSVNHHHTTDSSLKHDIIFDPPCRSPSTTTTAKLPSSAGILCPGCSTTPDIHKHDPSPAPVQLSSPPSKPKLTPGCVKKVLGTSTTAP